MPTHGIDPNLEICLENGIDVLQCLRESIDETIKLTYEINEVPKDIVDLNKVILLSLSELMAEIGTLKKELEKHNND